MAFSQSAHIPGVSAYSELCLSLLSSHFLGTYSDHLVTKFHFSTIGFQIRDCGVNLYINRAQVSRFFITGRVFYLRTFNIPFLLINWFLFSHES